MAIDAYLKFNLLYGEVGKTVSNALWYKVTAGVPSLANINGICTELMDAITPVLTPLLSDQYKFFGIEGKWRNGAVAFDGTSTGAAEVGTESTDEVLPEDDAVVIRKQSGFAGRNKRGRIFVGFVPEIFQNESRLTDPAIVLYQAFASFIKTPIVLPVAGVTLQPVTPDYKTATLIDVQQTAVNLDIMSRRDRRNPRNMVALSAP